MRSRVRTRTHGSVGRRGLIAPSDPISAWTLQRPQLKKTMAGGRCGFHKLHKPHFLPAPSWKVCLFLPLRMLYGSSSIEGHISEPTRVRLGVGRSRYAAENRTKKVYAPIAAQSRAVYQKKECTMNKAETNRFNDLYYRHQRSLKLQGLAESTRDSYARAVRRIKIISIAAPIN